MNFALFAALLFLGFGFLRRERKRERELESGKRHWQRVRLNYEKRLCILSPALPQTFASIMHTPTQSACGTQLQCTQREREREGYTERERASWAPAARTAPFCQASTVYRMANSTNFLRFWSISVGWLLGCLAWVTCNFDCQLRRLEDEGEEVVWFTWPQQRWSNWIYCKWQKDLSSGSTGQPNRLQLWGIIHIFLFRFFFLFFLRFWFWFVFGKQLSFGAGWIVNMAHPHVKNVAQKSKMSQRGSRTYWQRDRR